MRRIPSSGTTVGWLLAACLACYFAVGPARGASAADLFAVGSEAYKSGRFADAASAFEYSARFAPASGTLLNLGNAEWQRGRAGAAILAWERAQWLNPFHPEAAGNLQFGRKVAQLESPRLTWYEAVSTWLPVNWWAWVTGISLWAAVASGMLPGIVGWKRAAWQQAAAAGCLAIFLLSLPAQAGVLTRARVGFVMEKEAPLRLTPTAEAQVLTRMASGEPLRAERTRGKYILVQTSRGSGWLERNQVGLIASQSPRASLAYREPERARDGVK